MKAQKDIARFGNLLHEIWWPYPQTANKIAFCWNTCISLRNSSASKCKTGAAISNAVGMLYKTQSSWPLDSYLNAT